MFQKGPRRLVALSNLNLKQALSLVDDFPWAGHPRPGASGPGGQLETSVQGWPRTPSVAVGSGRRRGVSTGLASQERGVGWTNCWLRPDSALLAHLPLLELEYAPTGAPDSGRPSCTPCTPSWALKGLSLLRGCLCLPGFPRRPPQKRGFR